jgi:DNA polymerase-3 subunit alpha
LKSFLHISEYVETAKERGYETIGLMDENVLSGVLQLQSLADELGLKSIFGLTLTYMDEVEEEYSIQLIAKNFSGYQELMRLSSYRMTNTKVKLEDFLPFSDSMAVIFTDQSELFAKIEKSDFNIENWLKNFSSVNDKFMGVSINMSNEWQQYVNFQKFFPPFLLHEVRFLNPEDHSAYRVVCAIGKGETLQISEIESHGKKFLPEEGKLRQQVIEAGWAEAIENANKFLQKVNVKIPTKQHLLPKFLLPEGKNSKQVLKEQAFQMLNERFDEIPDEYQERLEMELGVISKMGFDDYFLIVADVLSYARKEGMFVGFGRGSAAGSLVAFALKITEVDPLVYGLLFERFLNSERYTLPDIDIDLPDNRRDQILQYIVQKYGANHVAQIATFGTLGAKQALRDVGRVMGISMSESNRWSKAIPNQLNLSLKEAYEQSKTFRELVSATPRNQTLFSLAQKLEGLPRHVSTHAAGIVISDMDLLQMIPLQEGGNSIFLTQFTMYDIEKVGLLKIDFLGLRNLTIIAGTLFEVKRKWGIDFSLTSDKFQDKATLNLFRNGNTSGIFQFESIGIKQVLRKVQPDSIEEIVAVNALYRPGPMENIAEFVARKKGLHKIEYLDPTLENILKNTYGIIVYQEQVMQILRKMANFTLSQADMVRRAIGKKERKLLEDLRRNFLKGSKANGYTEEVAVRVYDYIEKFAGYGFNRSHAFAYSFVGFEMAYLKVHFPGAFYASLLHSIRGNFKKIKEYLTEAKRRGVQILPPDINYSKYSFDLFEKDALRFGFSAIKGVRQEFIREILAERQENGSFVSMDQFLLRISSKWLKIEWLEPLIMTGVFDSLEKNRRLLMTSLEGKLQNILLSGGSFDLLEGVMKLKKNEVEDYSFIERLEQEDKFLGTCLSGHPLEQYLPQAEHFQISSIIDLEEGKSVRLMAMIRDFRVIRTKKRESMAFVEVSDLTGEASLTLFPKIYRKFSKELIIGKKLLVEGVVEKNSYNQAMQLIVSNLKDLEALKVDRTLQSVFIRLTSKVNKEEVLKQLQKVLLENPGDSSVVLYYAETNQQQRLKKPYLVKVNDSLITELKQIFGEEAVVVR